jgi:Mor family transcriptional regulator
MKTRKFNPEIQAEIVSLHRGGMTRNQLSERYKCDKGTIANVLRAAGIETRKYQRRTSPVIGHQGFNDVMGRMAKVSLFKNEVSV